MAVRRERPELKQDSDFHLDLSGALDNTFSRLSREMMPLDEEGRELTVPAPNAIEWVVGAEWCNVPSTYRISGQYQVIRDYFQLRCPICNEGGVGPGEPGNCMGKSQMYLESEVLMVWKDNYQEDCCPRCGSTRSELFEDGLIFNYNTLHAVVGQRAGKSICAGLIGAYVEHRLLTLGHGTPGGLGGYLNLRIKDPFEMTFLASTDTQSQDTIWAKYVAIRAESPWFQRYTPWVKKQEAAQIVPVGMKRWFYKESDKKIINAHPAIRLIQNSLNSNAPGLRGRTRPFAAADEISHMEQTESKKSATEIYRALERSLRTFRTRTKQFGGLPWLGTMVSVTSPVSRSDKGMMLLQDAKKVKTMYAVQLATWEFNPTEPRVNLQDEFDKDPVGAKRDYGAVPPGAEYPLIHDEARWKKLVLDEGLRAKADFKVMEFRGKTGQRYLAMRVARCDFVPDRIPRYAVWDAGINWDQFAGACAHGEWRENPETGVDRLHTVFDWVTRVLPIADHEIYFDSVTELMRDVRKSMPIARCEFDRWQSYQLIQQVRELGVFSEQASLKDGDWTQFKVDCFSGIVHMLPPQAGEMRPDTENFEWLKEPPQLSAMALAYYEILGAQCDPDTHKVTFPEKGDRRGWGSNDVAQVMVHAHKLCQAQGFTDRQDDRSLRAARIRAETTGSGWESRGTVANTASARSAPRNWGSSKRGW